MKTYRLKIVDAFTRTQFTGNPAGVVLDANGLTDGQMQSIARELNLSETAFVLRPSEAAANLQIRWFTPAQEVNLCGHATIASFHALSEEGLEGMGTNGQHYFKLQTKSGILAVRVEKNFYETTVEFELPVPKFKVCKKLPGPLLKSLGILNRDINSGLPAVFFRYLYIPVKNRKLIEKLKPDFKLLAKELNKIKAEAVCIFSMDPKEKSSAVHSRFFAPNYGIDEDPVTGSANGPLGCYLVKYVLPAGYKVSSRELSDGRIEFIGEQGDEIGRRGRVKIRVRMLDRSTENVSIAGEAVTILDANLKI